MRTMHLRSCGILIVLAAAACGGSEGGPSYATSIDDYTASEIGYTTAAYTQAVVGDLVVGTFRLGLSKGPEGPGPVERFIGILRARAYGSRSGPSFLATVPPPRVATACSPVLTGIDQFGDPIDSDGDGVPDDYSITFPAGCSVSEAGYTYTYSGSVRMRDLPGLLGYRLDADNYKERKTEDLTGDYEYLVFDGTEEAHYTASAITHTAKMAQTLGHHFSSATVAAQGTSSTAMASVGAQTLDYQLTIAYDPAGTISLAGGVPSGDVMVHVDLRIITSGDLGPESYHFFLDTPSPLYFDNDACLDIDSGTMYGDLNGHDNVGFDIDWTGCGDYAVTTRGTTEE